MSLLVSGGEGDVGRSEPNCLLFESLLALELVTDCPELCAGCSHSPFLHSHYWMSFPDGEGECTSTLPDSVVVFGRVCLL